VTKENPHYSCLKFPLTPFPLPCPLAPGWAGRQAHRGEGCTGKGERIVKTKFSADEILKMAERIEKNGAHFTDLRLKRSSISISANCFAT